MKTYKEQIEDLQKKQAQLKAQEKKLKAKQTEAERKARTHRLIQIGAAAESVLGRPIEEKELPQFIAFLQRTGTYGGNYFRAAMQIEKEDAE